MKGRAGRKGKDTVGESFLVCRKSDIVAVKALMEAKMPSVESCLAGEEGGLKRYVPAVSQKPRGALTLSATTSTDIS